MVEVGEKLATALAREVVEETGLEIESLAMFEIFERIMPDSAGHCEYHYVLIDYICQVAGGELAAASDVSAVRWVRRTQLSEFQITEGTLSVVERAFDSEILRRLM